MNRSRGFCFTINNPTSWDDHDIDTLKGQAEYIVIGKEHFGPNEGTPHYQGYVRFKSQRTFTRVQQLLPRAHIEIQKGTATEAAEYCKKDGDFEEWGTPPKSRGESTKEMWKSVIKWAEDGQVDRIKEEYPHIYFLHIKRIEGLRVRNPLTLQGELQHEWWYGPTGCGKSHKLWQVYPEHYQKNLTKWWDGYNNENTVAIEEMDPDHGKYLGHYIKIWCDRYPFSPEMKGGFLKKIRPLKIIILSNYTIDECFERKNDRDPIKRRFKVTHFPNIFRTNNN